MDRDEQERVKTRGGVPRGGAILLSGLLVILFPTTLQAQEDRVTLLGWVKQGLSPEEEARSASRASRLRPLPAEAVQQAPVSAPELNSLAAAPSPIPSATPVPVASRPPDSRPAEMVVEAEPVISPASVVVPPPPSGVGPATIEELRRRAEFLASRGLNYRFGGDHPSEGGMDCSGTMQFLLKSIGYDDIPRTSYDQFEWLKQQGTLRRVGFFRGPAKAVRNFRPGDLIFWGGTYNSGHRVSHVMIYMGQSRSGTHYVFGARGKKVKGLNGNGVDIFEYRPESTGGKLLGYGPLPGMRRN